MRLTTDSLCETVLTGIGSTDESRIAEARIALAVLADRAHATEVRPATDETKKRIDAIEDEVTDIGRRVIRG